MKSFSHDLSPIHIKNHSKDYLFEQFIPKVEPKDVSNINHSFQTLQLGNHLMEQRIVSTAKTIVYLFSPDIDLLQRLQHNIQNYDKYQKTKMLLRQLFSTFNGTQIQNEVMRTTEEIEKLQWEIEELSNGFNQLEEENRAKDDEINKYRNSIIDLSKAYEEAKIYFMDQILQYKYQIQELKENLEHKAKRERSKSKSKGKKVTLNVPKDHRSNNTEAYTDRSIYKRFSASQVQQEQNYSAKQTQNHTATVSSYTAGRHLIEKHEFEKENLQSKIMALEASIRRLQEQNTALKGQREAEVRELGRKIHVLEEQLRDKTIKLKLKNKTICELLDDFQAYKSREA